MTLSLPPDHEAPPPGTDPGVIWLYHKLDSRLSRLEGAFEQWQNMCTERGRDYEGTKEQLQDLKAWSDRTRGQIALLGIAMPTCVLVLWELVKRWIRGKWGVEM